jgi:uncharacterized membrane protein YbhN (UPF0104 family)
VKEAVNALLPVAQVGGDVVRTRVAAGARLSLMTGAAAAVVDVFVSLACLVVFILAGLAAVSWIEPDPRIDRLSLQLAIAGGLVVVSLIAAERLGVLRLFDAATAKSAGALGGLSGLGSETVALCKRPHALAVSLGWHLVAWSMGVIETRAALWALGLESDWTQAFILESLAQGARAVGFAVPGALGIQEGGYLIICSTLGIPADKAVALALLRRLRELILGAAGLWVWQAARRAHERELRASA